MTMITCLTVVRLRNTRVGFTGLDLGMAMDSLMA